MSPILKMITAWLIIVCSTLALLVWAQAWQKRGDKFCSCSSEFDQETERVMEWKNSWAECMEDIDRYVEESREIVCWDTLVEWQEECDKEMRQCEFTYNRLMECEGDLAELKREYEKQRRMCLDCIVADIIKAKDGTH